MGGIPCFWMAAGCVMVGCMAISFSFWLFFQRLSPCLPHSRYGPTTRVCRAHRDVAGARKGEQVAGGPLLGCAPLIGGSGHACAHHRSCQCRCLRHGPPQRITTVAAPHRSRPFPPQQHRQHPPLFRGGPSPRVMPPRGYRSTRADRHPLFVASVVCRGRACEQAAGRNRRAGTPPRLETRGVPPPQHPRNKQRRGEPRRAPTTLRGHLPAFFFFFHKASGSDGGPGSGAPAAAGGDAPPRRGRAAAVPPGGSAPIPSLPRLWGG